MKLKAHGIESGRSPIKITIKNGWHTFFSLIPCPLQSISIPINHIDAKAKWNKTHFTVAIRFWQMEREKCERVLWFWLAQAQSARSGGRRRAESCECQRSKWSEKHKHKTQCRWKSNFDSLMLTKVDIYSFSHVFSFLFSFRSSGCMKFFYTG